MPRYFIDLTDGVHSHTDVEGSDLPSLSQACRETSGMLPQLAGDKLIDGQSRHFVATLRDENGKPIYRATLSYHGEMLD